ncbi:MAG TPA: M48 family metallopeptidase [Pyrinomonadaceae bacterium]|jgi:predicted Zn-dependent protease|nr:M48 family metallopeptidase [Pyrinomonadaceae bacterium]HLC13070.1 M48 family metallopeptidase [Chthoniobacterales bacterium]
MERRHIKWLPLLLAGLFFAYQYFSSEKFVNPETGRKSHVAMSTREEASLGVQSYQQVLAQSESINSGPDLEMVKRVASRLATATGKAGADFDWQVSLIRSSQANAFCLPGGKIVVYTGIIPITQNEPALATVLGHEMAHATSRHGSQRVLEQNLAQTALTGVAMSLSDMDYDKQRAVMGALGAGTQFGVLMPFSRKHESEADEIGLLYMARAGYDPRESIRFWQRMENAGGAQPPEFLSSHPSHGTRIQQLEAEMPKALEEYNKSSHADAPASL